MFLALAPAISHGMECATEVHDDCREPLEYLGGQHGCECFVCAAGNEDQWVLCTTNQELAEALTFHGGLEEGMLMQFMPDRSTLLSTQEIAEQAERENEVGAEPSREALEAALDEMHEIPPETVR